MVQNSALLYSVVQEVVKVEVPRHLDVVQLASLFFFFLFWKFSLNLVVVFQGSQMNFYTDLKTE